MNNNTRATILSKSKSLFALNGYEGFSIRKLSVCCHSGISSIYHFFEDKDILLKEVFDRTNTELGAKRAKLPALESSSESLRQIIGFQFENIEDIVFVLKYYLHFRESFKKIDNGYIPEKAYLHIEEILADGVASGEFYIKPSEIVKESKVITHAINGFLLEYYPRSPTGKELDEVVYSINNFILRSLKNKEA